MQAAAGVAAHPSGLFLRGQVDGLPGGLRGAVPPLRLAFRLPPLVDDEGEELAPE